MSEMPWLHALTCDWCHSEGRMALADYTLRPDDEADCGPLMGDPDLWPSFKPGWNALCEAHFAQMPPDCRLDYIPVSEDVPLP